MAMEHQPETLSQRIDNLTALLQELEQELAQLKTESELAPAASWITRYKALGHKKYYWYYKWQATDPVFPTKQGKPSRYQHLGKAGSLAYIKAVEQIVKRGQVNALEQGISTLKAGLEELVAEGREKSSSSR
jgi:prefoldin subunit 5